MFGPGGGGRLLVGPILVVSVILSGCGSGPGRTAALAFPPVQTLKPPPSPATRPHPSSIPATTPTIPSKTPAQGGGTVPPELIGTWTQDNVGSSTIYFIRRAYSFTGDGTYALIDMLCSQDNSGTHCQPDDSPEAGVATVDGNVLSLTPTTVSDEGPRAYRFAVVPDQVTGNDSL